MPRTSIDEPIRRKMRKGTHSCFECRRRKIRCVFPLDNPTVCTECFARGSHCIDQEHADSDAIVDTRKNLRERVSRLESLIESLLEDRNQNEAVKALGGLSSGCLPPTPLSADSPASVPHQNDSAPVLAMFDNDVLSRTEAHTPDKTSAMSGSGSGSETSSITDCANKMCEIPTRNASFGLTCEYTTTDDPPNPSARLKHERTRKALLSAIPPRDQLPALLERKAKWWTMFREKTPGTSWVKETLLQFANRTLSGGTIEELGTLVVAVGVCLDGDLVDRHLNLVDKLIQSDDEYASTLRGMECSLLMVKTYTDIGQPRKAWLTARRALSFAQLMGLHRRRTTSVDRESIWWGLYLTDRFLSLLLGLPSGVNDAHCDLEMKHKPPYVEGNANLFVTKLCWLAGKIIDRTQGMAETTFASTMDLDQELENVASKMKTSWWDIPSAIVAGTLSAADLKERLFMQLTFHQIRLYLHLPFMLKSSTNPRYDICRQICSESAREMIRIYGLIHTCQDAKEYDCRAIDFIAFTAAIVLILGLLGYGRMPPEHHAHQDHGDWQLLESAMEHFRQVSARKGGQVPAQCYQALQQLSSFRNGDQSGAPEEQKIVIPYFGTISIRRSNKLSTTEHVPAPMPVQDTSYATNFSTNAYGEALDASGNPLIFYDGIYVPHNSPPTAFPTPSTDSGMESFFGVEQDPALWQNVSNMEIDQDWSWFLNDMQSQQFQQQHFEQH